MNTFHFRAAPLYGFMLVPATQQLSADVLGQALPGAIVHALEAAPDGGYDVVVQLQRDAHPDALQEISEVLQQFGYNVVQAVVVEWVTAAVEAGLVAAGVGGTLGAAATHDVSAAIAVAILGGFAGYALGAQRPIPKTIYDAYRMHQFPGGWQVTQRPKPGTQPDSYEPA